MFSTSNKILLDALVLLGMTVGCADGIFIICFSGRTTVRVLQDGATATTKSMDQLKIGDRVLTKGGTYSKVYSFAHYLPQARVEFVQIRTAADTDAPLEISADHMLFVNDAVQPAKYVRAGDTVIGSDGTTRVSVAAVDRVVQTGAYGPLTETGTIQVNSVAASNYIALDVLEPLLSHRAQHWIYHRAMAPHRYLCTAFGCENEIYDEAGFNHRVARMLPLIAATEWLVQLNWLRVLLVGIAVGYLFWKKPSSSSSQAIKNKRAHPAAKLKI